MKRRSFIGALPAAGFAQAGGEKKTRVYMMETFLLKAGNQLTRLHGYLSQSALPALIAVHSGPTIVLEGLIVPHTPQVVLIMGFASFEEMWNIRAKLNQNQELERAFMAWQSAAEGPFESQSNVLLEATEYSPEIAALDPPPASPRIFELRVYHSPSWQHLKFLHERFAGPESKIFHRVGVHPILYSSTIIGPNMPNLTYLIPFESLAARETAWNAFAADPEWVKVRKESIDQHGQITANNLLAIYRAAAYSPIR